MIIQICTGNLFFKLPSIVLLFRISSVNKVKVMENLFVAHLIVSKGHGICICPPPSCHFVLFLKWVNYLSLPHFEI